MGATARAPLTISGTYGTRDDKLTGSHIDLRNAPIDEQIAELAKEADANTKAAEEAADHIGSDTDGVIY